MVAWLQRRSLSLRRVLIVKELSKFLMKLLTEVLFETARKPKNNGSVVLICIRFVINYTFWTCKQIKAYNENADILFGINTEQAEVWYFA